MNDGGDTVEPSSPNGSPAEVFGLALYNPIWTNGVRTPRDFALAVGGFLLLTVWKAPP
jgi:chromate transporter